MSDRYEPHAIESKWQRVWADEGTWEVSVQPQEQAQAAGALYAGTYMVVEQTYLVPEDSPFQRVADLDGPGVRIVVNRWSKQIELDVRQVERYLGEKVTGYVQSDYNTAVNSINLGQPLVESNPTSRIATHTAGCTSGWIGLGREVCSAEGRSAIATASVISERVFNSSMARFWSLVTRTQTIRPVDNWSRTPWTGPL